MSENETAYYKSAGFLKGIAITSIVFVHSFSNMAPEFPLQYTNNSMNNPALDLFFSGLMMFFLLSGYFYKPKNGFWKNTKKRIIQIVPVFIICGIVLTLIMVGWGNIYGFFTDADTLIKDLVDTLTAFAFQEPWVEGSEYGYVLIGWYFLMNILSALIIFYAIADKCIKNLKRLAVSVAICVALQILVSQFVNIWLPLRLDLAPIAVSFMLIGAFMKRIDVIPFLENNWKTKKFWMILIPVAAVGLTVSVFFPTGCKYSIGYFGEYGSLSVISFFIIMICDGFFLLCFSAIVCHLRPLSDFFSFISKYSMHILLVHGFYLKLLQTPFYGMSTVDFLAYMPTLPAVLIAVSSLALSVLTSYIGVKVYGKLKTKYNRRIKPPRPLASETDDFRMSHLHNICLK